MERGMTCCFAGPCTLSGGNIESVVQQLNCEVERLIDLGVTNFLSSGEAGFEQIAAALILAKREMGMPIRLILVPSCREQDIYRSEAQAQFYQTLLAEADHVIRTGETPLTEGARKRFMASRAAYCICAGPHAVHTLERTDGRFLQDGPEIIRITG